MKSRYYYGSDMPRGVGWRIADILFFPVSIFYMEITVAIHAFGFGGINVWNTVYILLFSFSAGAFIYGLCAFIPTKGRYVTGIVLISLLTILYGTQAVYYTVFKTFTVISSVLRAGDVLGDFGEQAVQGIWRSGLTILFLLLPLIIYIVLARRFLSHRRPRWKRAVAGLAGAIVFYAGALCGIYMHTGGIMSDRYVYFDTFSPVLSVPRFGILTTLRLDIENMIFPQDILDRPSDEEKEEDAADTSGESGDDQITDNEPDDEADGIDEEPVVFEPRVLEIDFDQLIAQETDDTIKNMHQYFKNVEPTMENEYTGMFKGKNLIWIVAEAFSSYALDETHTPTLSKLAREGFVFNNFYNPVWGVSTSDGEYVTLTSLIPKSGVWSFSRSSDNYMPFAFGNMLRETGYNTLAYHNHTYTYYDRDSSHPNMGYDYKGVGNGLEVETTWPESDLEMMEKTVGEYSKSEPFHVYYLTVSGHMNYNFYGNMMCYKHRDDVQDMLDAGYSEAASAYVACQMEFDQAVEYLIDSLEDAGVLDDTVIVISGDHYPYGLETEQIQELSDWEIDSMEVHRSTLIIWNSQMEPVSVDKYCSSLDIMPTLANLFDLPVDSRLVMGRDILSDADPLVIFNDRSFITDMGRYDASTDTFTPNEGVQVPEGYAAEILDQVNDKFDYSRMILDYDYYAKVFEN